MNLVDYPLPGLRGRPIGLERVALRLPVWLYRFRLGRVLGRRFLLLTHIGRRSGRLRRTVLEPLRSDPATDSYIVCSVWGTRSDWLQNIDREPRVTITVGSRILAARAERLTRVAAARELFDFARCDPIAFRRLMRWLVGQALDGTPELCHALARWIPIVALRAREAAPTHAYQGPRRQRSMTRSCPRSVGYRSGPAAERPTGGSMGQG